MAHAILSASGSKRWLECTPSARLEQNFEDQTSVYAQEGTLAHELGELNLRYQFKEMTKVQLNRKVRKIEKHELYDKSMPDYVESYVGYVVEKYNEAKSRCSDPIISIEQRLDFSHLVPKGFGTGDAVIIADGILEIIDLKYGKGIEVSAEDNTQMMLYALGALNAFEILYDIDEVHMTIVQPRLDNISTSVMTTKDLYKWAFDYLKPRAELAWKGEGDFVAGDHCIFCKARFTCRARAEANMELAKHDFAPAEELSEDEIPEILSKAEQLKAWIKDIEEYTLNQALQGVKWTGFKLVEGRSNRKYVDDIKVAETLTNKGYDEAVIYEKKLLGITKMTKLLGKKQFTSLLNDLIEKPPGKPTLVPESDKRPEMNSAKEDFKNENEGDDN